jgi:hypothetical protein
VLNYIINTGNNLTFTFTEELFWVNMRENLRIQELLHLKAKIRKGNIKEAPI